MKLIEYPDRDALMLDLAGVLAEELEMALLHEDRVTFVVPGGTTPGPVFDALSVANLDWSRIDVMLGDERWVPQTSDRSNTRLLKERLLTGRAAAATLLPLYAEAPAPEDKLDELIERVRPALPINVLLLGMGADMHTASLFPGADRLDDALSPDAPVLLPMRAPGAPEPRVTLTAPVLAGALAIHLVITGQDKRQALDTALASTDLREAPVSAILDNATVHWAE